MSKVRHQRNYLKTLARGMQVLSAFTPEHPARSLTELAEVMKLDAATVYRFVYTLEHLGYVRRDPVTRCYWLSSRVLMLSRAVDAPNELRTLARPFLEELAQTTGETVELAARDGEQIVVVDTLESRQRVAVRGWVGRHLPLYCTAQGKVLLAHLTPESLSLLLASIKLEAHGPNTLTTRAALEKELKRTAKRGYGLNDNEMNIGIQAIAAPIRGPGEEVVAALGIAMPIGRMTLSEMETALAEVVMVAAGKIGEALGYREA
jgi:DNA-binding IclR family transcriptional regulator